MLNYGRFYRAAGNYPRFLMTSRGIIERPRVDEHRDITNGPGVGWVETNSQFATGKFEAFLDSPR
jgi:hypothetical protein